MKLIFAGTPPFAAAALTALHAAGHDITLVLTQPDRPAGRGQRDRPSAVADEATRLGLPVAKPASLRDPAVHELLSASQPDVMVVAAYGLLLPQAVLDIPTHGCLNIHGSLLPRWRGAAPVQRAIEAGDSETGIDIMQMEAGLDTGPVLLEQKISIAADDTSATLFAKLTTLGASAIVDALSRLSQLSPQAQVEAGATYARKIEKREAHIDWTQPAAIIERKIRAFDPFPGTETLTDSQDENSKLKIWRAVSAKNSSNAAPGLVIDVSRDGLVVACGEGALSLTVVQRPGGKRQPIAEYLRANPIAPGTQFK